MQLQIVDMVLQGHNPAVQQAGWAHQLAAEVVDDETAAQRLHMQGGLVEVAVSSYLRSSISSVSSPPWSQKAAGKDPAPVIFLGADKRLMAIVIHVRGSHRGMNAGIVEAEDLAFDGDRIRHVNHVAEDAAE